MGQHDPEWPDKAMFAALLLILAGLLGAGFELVRDSVVRVADDRLPQLFTEDVPYYTLGLSLATVALGIACLRTQAALWGYLGALTAIASLGLYGVESFLGFAAVAALIKSHIEGEETRNDGHRLHPSQWPDKAMAASLLLFVAAALLAVQGVAILAGRFDPILPLGRMAGAVDLAAAAFLVWACREVYHLRRAGWGFAAGIVGVLTFGFYILGPLLALLSMLLLGMARREGEFATPPASAPKPPPVKAEG